MENFKHIIVEKGIVSTLWLNRPDVRNAFNEEVIDEIIHALNILKSSDCRVLVLKGKGKAFCAGADLQWMKKAKDYSYEQNLKESNRLAECLQLLYTFPKPTVAVIHGASFGGANGLLSACDFAIAEENTTFSLSEVKLGLIPATISPYVIKRVGEHGARELMLTARPIKGTEAKAFGLINFSGDKEAIYEYMEGLLKQLLQNSPNALTETKKLISSVVNRWTMKEAIPQTSEWIAQIRNSDEAQEGMSAFFEKRKPNWRSDG